jgi:hypothetical protein
MPVISANRHKLNQNRRDTGKEKTIEAWPQHYAGIAGHFLDQDQKKGN